MQKTIDYNISHSNFFFSFSDFRSCSYAKAGLCVYTKATPLLYIAAPLLLWLLILLHRIRESTTRNSRFSCGFKWKFRRKPFSSGFCQGFRFPGNTFVGNWFLRILGSAGKEQKSAGHLQSVFEEIPPAR